MSQSATLPQKTVNQPDVPVLTSPHTRKYPDHPTETNELQENVFDINTVSSCIRSQAKMSNELHTQHQVPTKLVIDGHNPS